MTTLNLYDDAALTTLATEPLAFVQDTLGAISPHQRRFYLGQPTSGYRFRANSDPGVTVSCFPSSMPRPETASLPPPSSWPPPRPA